MTRKIILFILAATFALSGAAQNRKSRLKRTAQPASISFTRAELNKWLEYREGDVIRINDNRYIDKAVLELNTRNGDMQLLRIRLSYFKNALLMVQVNGTTSVQVFITSSDKKTFYKGKTDEVNVVLTKCKQEDIVQE